MKIDEIQDKLLYELLDGGQHATQMHTLRGQLYALVDMGWLNKEQRQELRNRFHSQLYPLLNEGEFSKLAPLGAYLIAPKATDFQAQYDLFGALRAYSSDVVSVWITSVLGPEAFCEHLQQAAVAYQEGGKRFLIRYYDPLITPILYGQAPAQWQKWFFAPVMSWWFAQVTRQHVQWYQLAGYGKKENAAPVPKLILSEEFLKVLEQDPMPFRVLEQVETLKTISFNTECRNMRLSQIKACVQQGQKQGFMSELHLLGFTKLALTYDMQSIIGHPRWGAIRQTALAKHADLEDLVHQHLLRQ